MAGKNITYRRRNCSGVRAKRGEAVVAMVCDRSGISWRASVYPASRRHWSSGTPGIDAEMKRILPSAVITGRYSAVHGHCNLQLDILVILTAGGD